MEHACVCLQRIYTINYIYKLKYFKKKAFAWNYIHVIAPRNIKFKFILIKLN